MYVRRCWTPNWPTNFYKQISERLVHEMYTQYQKVKVEDIYRSTWGTMPSHLRPSAWGAKETQVRRGLKCKEACIGWKVTWCTVGTKEPDEDVSAEWQTIPSQTRRFLQWLRWLTRDCRDGQLWEIEIMCCGRFLTQCFFVSYSNIYIAPLIARSHREALLSAISS